MSGMVLLLATLLLLGAGVKEVLAAEHIEISSYLVSLSRYDARKGALSEDQRNDVRAISSIINDWAKEHMRTKIDFVVPRELEEAIVTSDFSSFASSVAKRVVKWQSAQPLYRVKVWERWQLGETTLQLEQALSDEEAAEIAEAEGVSVGAVVGFIVGIYEAAVEVIDVINDVIDGFCGPDHEVADTPPGELPGGITLRRESYLHVPWRGVVWGKNNQKFEAQYIVRVNGGYLDELRVRFRIDLSGSGFDRLDYPIGARAVTADGIVDPTPSAIRTTRYQQIHEVVAHNVDFLSISVVGRVYYGSDGCMTDAGLVPSGTATKNGISVEFGQGDSIWKYGISY